jgi:hypothetical protein
MIAPAVKAGAVWGFRCPQILYGAIKMPVDAYEDSFDRHVHSLDAADTHLSVHVMQIVQLHCSKVHQQ